MKWKIREYKKVNGDYVANLIKTVESIEYVYGDFHRLTKEELDDLKRRLED